jgi:hypothetical protein
MQTMNPQSQEVVATEHAKTNDEVHPCNAQMRIANDGEAYNYMQFLAHYGQVRGPQQWDKCTIASNADTLQPIATQAGHGINCTQASLPGNASAILALPPVQSTGGDSSHDTALPEAAATERSDVVQLDQQQAAELRAFEQGHSRRPSLHNLARNALNSIARTASNSNVAQDLNDWFLWRNYVACHDMADGIIGTGITRATCEHIEGTRDANREGRARTDFVFYQADGTYCQLHPGAKKINDAKPVFDTLVLTGSPATEQTMSPYLRITQPEIPYTFTAAAKIPRHVLIGKAEAYRSLQNIPNGPLTATREAPFKWWLFVPNLGHNTCEVFGDGIATAELEDKGNGYVRLRFFRNDNTTIAVDIFINPHNACCTCIHM